MSNEELLQIEPQELQFPFELRKQISCSMQLINKRDNYVAFKVKTTNPKKYCVRPNTGVVLPHSTCDVIVTMQAQKESPADLQCKDKFLVQSVIAGPGATAKDITPNMFTKEEGHNVEESKLRVAYVAPPQPPSPVREGSEEGSSPRVSVSDNGVISTSEFSTATRTAEPQPFRSHVEPQVLRSHVESQDKNLEVKTLITKLTEEKNSAVQQKNKLQQEVVHSCSPMEHDEIREESSARIQKLRMKRKRFIERKDLGSRRLLRRAPRKRGGAMNRPGTTQLRRDTKIK